MRDLQKQRSPADVRHGARLAAAFVVQIESSGQISDGPRSSNCSRGEGEARGVAGTGQGRRRTSSRRRGTGSARTVLLGPRLDAADHQAAAASC
ncbi:hypothetical protein NL676_033635 [Syzygium grande]|nr:hypothetical protein NL676_033635 [Syzygium grande]